MIDKSSAWNDKTQCYLDSIFYNFGGLNGRLYLPQDNKCDMSGTIEMFKAIDPKVLRIDVFIWKEPALGNFGDYLPDVSYQRANYRDEWKIIDLWKHQ